MYYLMTYGSYSDKQELALLQSNEPLDLEALALQFMNPEDGALDSYGFIAWLIREHGCVEVDYEEFNTEDLNSYRLEPRDPLNDVPSHLRYMPPEWPTMTFQEKQAWMRERRAEAVS